MATASTKQYHAATPLGGLPCGNLEAGSITAQAQVPALVPTISSQEVMKNAPKYTMGERPLNK
jgi:hypothetical protein